MSITLLALAHSCNKQGRHAAKLPDHITLGLLRQRAMLSPFPAHRELGHRELGVGRGGSTSGFGRSHVDWVRHPKTAPLRARRIITVRRVRH